MHEVSTDGVSWLAASSYAELFGDGEAAPTIEVECPGCGKTIKAPSKYAGRTANCPGCGHAVEIVDPVLAGLFGGPPPPPRQAKRVAKLGPPDEFIDGRTAQIDADQSSGASRRHASASRDDATCPYCAEIIKAEAVKCKHCGEFLDQRLRQQQARVVNSGGAPKPSPGVAMVLSLVIPGAGQMYSGNVGSGFLWMICTAIGYAFFIIPGAILHIVCILSAGSAARDA
jgi:TM2 domain-containing membrane protein YozV